MLVRYPFTLIDGDTYLDSARKTGSPIFCSSQALTLFWLPHMLPNLLIISNIFCFIYPASVAFFIFIVQLNLGCRKKLHAGLFQR